MERTRRHCTARVGQRMVPRCEKTLDVSNTAPIRAQTYPSTDPHISFPAPLYVQYCNFAKWIAGCIVPSAPTIAKIVSPKMISMRLLRVS